MFVIAMSLLGCAIPHAASMRLKMAQCNIWDMPAPIMHEPPPQFLAVRLKDYFTVPHNKFWKDRKPRRCVMRWAQLLTSNH